MRRAAILFLALVFAGAAGGAPEEPLEKARRLAGERRYDEALNLYASLLEAQPRSREAALGRAETLLWAGRYREAEEAYRRLAEETPADAAVLRGLARAAYWSGDFRRARERFRALSRAVPGDAEAREALAAFALLVRPTASLLLEGARDSQPAESGRGELSGRVWLDPLSFLEADAGAGEMRAADLPSNVGLSRARLRLSTKLPRARLAVTFSAGLLRVGGAGRLLASAAVEREMTRTLRASLGVERGAALDAALSYRAAVPEEQAFLRLARHDAPVTGAAEVRALSWHDGNAGLSAHAWGEARLLSRGGVTLAAGGAVAWRDTRESRTRAVVDGSDPLPGGGFRYRIRTLFDPYVTPERQLEGRLLAHATLRRGPRLRLDLTGEAGVGRERATGWGPEAGPTPLPPVVAAGTYVRTYRPWRAALVADWSGERWGARAEAVRSSSATYTATTVSFLLRRTL